MLKKTLLSTLCFTLVGCTASIKEKSFIAQDEVITNYQQSEMNTWQSKFPDHQLQSISLTTNDKSATLKGIFFDNPTSDDVIFFIPGNGMSVSKTAEKSFGRLQSLGKDIVYFDRRGLGASSGEATIEKLSSDGLEMLAYIRSHIKPNQIIVHGYSLGSFVAGHIAKHEKIDALVLEGSATNVNDWIDHQVPWYTKPFLTIEVDEAFNTVDNANVLSEHYAGPVFILGAENDEQVPVTLSSKLFEASQSAHKILAIVEGADHGAMLDGVKEVELYRTFLNSI